MNSHILKHLPIFKKLKFKEFYESEVATNWYQLFKPYEIFIRKSTKEMPQDREFTPSSLDFIEEVLASRALRIRARLDILD